MRNSTTIADSRPVVSLQVTRYPGNLHRAVAPAGSIWTLCALRRCQFRCRHRRIPISFISFARYFPTGSTALTDDVAQSMRAGNAYIVVTTVDHPSGAIRGQLVPQPVRLPNTP